jgi:hypothetical protein
MQLPHWLTALTHADRFAAPGGTPTFGDMFQAIGNDMMNHQRYGTNDPGELARMAAQQHVGALPGQFGSNPFAYGGPAAPPAAPGPFVAPPTMGPPPLQPLPNVPIRTPQQAVGLAPQGQNGPIPLMNVLPAMANPGHALGNTPTLSDVIKLISMAQAGQGRPLT